jgi:hypothetical protein
MKPRNAIGKETIQQAQSIAPLQIIGRETLNLET